MNRTGNHSQGRKTGRRILYGTVFLRFPPAVVLKEKDRHAHPFTGLPRDSKISKEHSSDSSAYIAQFHTPLQSSKWKEGLIGASPPFQD